MEKERLAAFTDALLAIVMTILVLELERPEEISLSGFWELRTSFFSYAVSFFWLGAMWVNLHMEWQAVRKVNNRTVWFTVLMLFFSSLFPYVTSIVDNHFYNTAAQVAYGLVVLCVTAANVAMYSSLIKADPENEYFVSRMYRRARWARIDIGIKLVGLLLAVTVYPPAMMLSVLLTLLVIVIPQQFKAKGIFA